MKKEKENIFILILSISLLILALTVGYFYWQQKTAVQSEQDNPKPPLAPDGSSSSTKLQVCPEHWINNQAPCAYVKSPNECGNREYFIINGQRTELNEVDVDWVKQNCSTKREIAY